MLENKFSAVYKSYTRRPEMKELITVLIESFKYTYEIYLVAFSGWFLSCLIERGDRPGYTMHKRGFLIALVYTALALAAVYRNMDNMEVVIAINYFYALGLPLVISDAQQFSLPRISSVIYLIFIPRAIRYLTGENMTFYLMYFAIVFVVLYLITRKLKVGIADIYVFASLFCLILSSYGTSFLLGIFYAGIASIVRFAMYSLARNTEATRGIPFVPVLLNAVCIMTIL